MIKGAVANLLNTYLGQFVEDFGVLDVKAWSGEVNLRNIRIRPAALDMLQLPVTVSAGTIGRIHLAADWRSLKSKPVRLVLEDISACARPKASFDLDPEVVRATALAEKTAKLAKLQETQLAGPAAADEAPSGMMARLAATIAANLQIEIRRVHVRYEAPLNAANPGRRFAAGLVLDSLVANTSDAAGAALFVQHSFEKLFKRVRWEGLAIYVDPAAAGTNNNSATSSSGVGTSRSSSSSKVGASESASTSNEVPPPPPLPARPGSLNAAASAANAAASAYLCQPLAGTLMAEMTRTLSDASPCRMRLRLTLDEPAPAPQTSASTSASGAESVLSPTAASTAGFGASASVALSFSNPQLAPLLALVDTVATAQEKLALLTAAESSHFTALSPEATVRYTALYRRRFDGPLPRLTQSEMDELAAMDLAARFEDLARARSRAFIEMQREGGGKRVTLRSEKAASSKPGFFSRLFGGGGAAAASPSAAAEDAFTAEERAEIEGMLDASWEAAVDVRSATTDARYELLAADVSLPAVIIVLAGARGPLLHLTATGVRAQLALRPSSTSVACALAALTVIDAAPHVTFHRAIVAPRPLGSTAAGGTSGSGTAPPLLALEFHQSPPAHVLPSFRAARGLASVPLPATPPAAGAPVPPGLLLRLELQPVDIAVDSRVAAAVTAFALPVAEAARTVIEAAFAGSAAAADADAARVDSADGGALHGSASSVAGALGQKQLRSLAMAALGRIFAGQAHPSGRARPELELAVTVRAPTLILPAAADRPHCDMLVVDLGQITVTSAGADAAERQKQDRVAVGYDALQAWVVRSGAVWRDAPYGNYRLLPHASAPAVGASSAPLDAACAGYAPSPRDTWLLLSTTARATVQLALRTHDRFRDLPRARLSGSLPQLTLRLGTTALARVAATAQVAVPRWGVVMELLSGGADAAAALEGVDSLTRSGSAAGLLAHSQSALLGSLSALPRSVSAYTARLATAPVAAAATATGPAGALGSLGFAGTGGYGDDDDDDDAEAMLGMYAHLAPAGATQGKAMLTREELRAALGVEAMANDVITQVLRFRLRVKAWAEANGGRAGGGDYDSAAALEFSSTAGLSSTASAAGLAGGEEEEEVEGTAVSWLWFFRWAKSKAEVRRRDTLLELSTTLPSLHVLLFSDALALPAEDAVPVSGPAALLPPAVAAALRRAGVPTVGATAAGHVPVLVCSAVVSEATLTVTQSKFATSVTAVVTRVTITDHVHAPADPAAPAAAPSLPTGLILLSAGSAPGGRGRSNAPLSVCLEVRRPDRKADLRAAQGLTGGALSPHSSADSTGVAAAGAGAAPATAASAALFDGSQIAQSARGLPAARFESSLECEVGTVAVAWLPQSAAVIFAALPVAALVNALDEIADVFADERLLAGGVSRHGTPAASAGAGDPKKKRRLVRKPRKAKAGDDHSASLSHDDSSEKSVNEKSHSGKRRVVKRRSGTSSASHSESDFGDGSGGTGIISAMAPTIARQARARAKAEAEVAARMAKQAAAEADEAFRRAAGSAIVGLSQVAVRVTMLTVDLRVPLPAPAVPVAAAAGGEWRWPDGTVSPLPRLPTATAYTLDIEEMGAVSQQQATRVPSPATLRLWLASHSQLRCALGGISLTESAQASASVGAVAPEPTLILRVYSGVELPPSASLMPYSTPLVYIVHEAREFTGRSPPPAESALRMRVGGLLLEAAPSVAVRLAAYGAESLAAFAPLTIALAAAAAPGVAAAGASMASSKSPAGEALVSPRAGASPRPALPAPATAAPSSAAPRMPRLDISLEPPMLAVPESAGSRRRAVLSLGRLTVSSAPIDAAPATLPETLADRDHVRASSGEALRWARHASATGAAPAEGLAARAALTAPLLRPLEEARRSTSPAEWNALALHVSRILAFTTDSAREDALVLADVVAAPGTASPEAANDNTVILLREAVVSLAAAWPERASAGPALADLKVSTLDASVARRQLVQFYATAADASKASKDVAAAAPARAVWGCPSDAAALAHAAAAHGLSDAEVRARRTAALVAAAAQAADSASSDAANAALLGMTPVAEDGDEDDEDEDEDEITLSNAPSRVSTSHTAGDDDDSDDDVFSEPTLARTAVLRVRDRPDLHQSIIVQRAPDASSAAVTFAQPAAISDNADVPSLVFAAEFGGAHLTLLAEKRGVTTPAPLARLGLSHLQLLVALGGGGNDAHSKDYAPAPEPSRFVELLVSRVSARDLRAHGPHPGYGYLIAPLHAIRRAHAPAAASAEGDAEAGSSQITITLAQSSAAGTEVWVAINRPTGVIVPSFVADMLEYLAPLPPPADAAASAPPALLQQPSVTRQRSASGLSTGSAGASSSAAAARSAAATAAAAEAARPASAKRVRVSVVVTDAAMAMPLNSWAADSVMLLQRCDRLAVTLSLDPAAATGSVAADLVRYHVGLGRLDTLWGDAKATAEARQLVTPITIKARLCLEDSAAEANAAAAQAAMATRTGSESVYGGAVANMPHSVLAGAAAEARAHTQAARDVFSALGAPPVGGRPSATSGAAEWGLSCTDKSTLHVSPVTMYLTPRDLVTVLDVHDMVTAAVAPPLRTHYVAPFIGIAAGPQAAIAEGDEERCDDMEAAPAAPAPLPPFWIEVQCDKIAVYLLTDAVPTSALSAGLETVTIGLRNSHLSVALDTVATRFAPPAQKQNDTQSGKIVSATAALAGSVESAIITPTRFTLDLTLAPLGGATAVLASGPAPLLRPVVTVAAERPFQVFVSDTMLLDIVAIIKEWDPPVARAVDTIAALPVQLGLAAADVGAVTPDATPAPALIETAGLELALSLSEVSVFLDKARPGVNAGVAPLFLATARGVMVAHTTHRAGPGLAPAATTSISLQALECWDLKNVGNELCVVSIDTGAPSCAPVPTRGTTKPVAAAATALSALPGDDCPVFIHIDSPELPLTDEQGVYEYMVHRADAATAAQPLMALALRLHSVRINWSPDWMAELFDLIFSVTGGAAAIVTPPELESEEFYEALFTANTAAGHPRPAPNAAIFASQHPNVASDVKNPDATVSDSAMILPYFALDPTGASALLPPAAVLDSEIRAHLEHAVNKAAADGATASTEHPGAPPKTSCNVSGELDRLWPKHWRGGTLVRSILWGQQPGFRVAQVFPCEPTAPARTPMSVRVDVTTRSVIIGLHKDGGRLGGVAVAVESRKIFRADITAAVVSVSLPLLPPATYKRGPGSVQVEGGVRSLHMYKLDSVAPVPADVAAAAGVPPEAMAHMRASPAAKAGGVEGEEDFIDPWGLIVAITPGKDDEMAAAFAVRRPPMPPAPAPGAPKPFYDYNQVAISAGNVDIAFQLSPVLELVDYILSGIIGAIPGAPPPVDSVSDATSPSAAPSDASPMPVPAKSSIIDMLPLPAPGVPASPSWGTGAVRMLVRVGTLSAIAPRSSVAPDVASSIAMIVRGVTMTNAPERDEAAVARGEHPLEFDRLTLTVDALAAAALPADPTVIAAAAAAAAGSAAYVSGSRMTLRTGHELRAAPADRAAAATHKAAISAAIAAGLGHSADPATKAIGLVPTARLDKTVSMRSAASAPAANFGSTVASQQNLSTLSLQTSAPAPATNARTAALAGLDLGMGDIVVPQKKQHTPVFSQPATSPTSARAPGSSGPFLPSAAAFEAVMQRSHSPGAKNRGSLDKTANDVAPLMAAAAALRAMAPKLAARTFPKDLIMAIKKDEAAASDKKTADTPPLTSLVAASLEALWPSLINAGVFGKGKPIPARAPWLLPAMPLITPTRVGLDILAALDRPAFAAALPDGAPVKVSLTVGHLEAFLSASRLECLMRVLAGNLLLDPVLAAAAVQAARVKATLLAGNARADSLFNVFGTGSMAMLGASELSAIVASESSWGPGTPAMSDAPSTPDGASPPGPLTGLAAVTGSESQHKAKVASMMSSLLATAVASDSIEHPSSSSSSSLSLAVTRPSQQPAPATAARARRIIFQEDTPWAFTKAMMGLVITSARINMCEEEVDRSPAAAPLYRTSQSFLAAEIGGVSLGWRRLGLAGALTSIAFNTMLFREIDANARGLNASAAARGEEWRSLVLCPSSHPLVAARGTSQTLSSPGDNVRTLDMNDFLAASPQDGGSSPIKMAVRPVIHLKILQSLSLVSGRRRAIDVDVCGLTAFTNPRALMRLARAVTIPPDCLDPPPCTIAAAITAAASGTVDTHGSGSVPGVPLAASAAGSTASTFASTSAPAAVVAPKLSAASSTPEASAANVGLGRDHITLRVRVSALQAVTVDPLTAAALVVRTGCALAMSRTVQPPVAPALGLAPRGQQVVEILILGVAAQAAVHSCSVRQLWRAPSLDSTIVKPVSVRAVLASTQSVLLSVVDQADLVDPSAAAGGMPLAALVTTRGSATVGFLDPLAMTLSLGDLGIAMSARDAWVDAAADMDLWDKEQTHARAALAAFRLQAASSAASAAAAAASPSGETGDGEDDEGSHVDALIQQQLVAWGDVAGAASGDAHGYAGNAFSLAADAARASALPAVAGVNLNVVRVTTAGEKVLRIDLLPITVTAVDNLSRRFVPVMCLRVTPTPVDVSLWAVPDGWAGNMVSRFMFAVEYHDPQSLALRALVHETNVISEARFFLDDGIAASSSARTGTATALRTSALDTGSGTASRNRPFWMMLQVNSPIDVRVSTAFLLSIFTAYSDWTARRQAARSSIHSQADGTAGSASDTTSTGSAPVRKTAQISAARAVMANAMISQQQRIARDESSVGEEGDDNDGEDVDARYYSPVRVRNDTGEAVQVWAVLNKRALDRHQAEINLSDRDFADMVERLSETCTRVTVPAGGEVPVPLCPGLRMHPRMASLCFSVGRGVSAGRLMNVPVSHRGTQVFPLSVGDSMPTPSPMGELPAQQRRVSLSIRTVDSSRVVIMSSTRSVHNATDLPWAVQATLPDATTWECIIPARGTVPIPVSFQQFEFVRMKPATIRDGEALSTSPSRPQDEDFGWSQPIMAVQTIAKVPRNYDLVCAAVATEALPARACVVFVPPMQAEGVTDGVFTIHAPLVVSNVLPVPACFEIVYRLWMPAAQRWATRTLLRDVLASGAETQLNTIDWSEAAAAWNKVRLNSGRPLPDGPPDAKPAAQLLCRVQCGGLGWTQLTPIIHSVESQHASREGPGGYSGLVIPRSRRLVRCSTHDDGAASAAPAPGDADSMPLILEVDANETLGAAGRASGALARVVRFFADSWIINDTLLPLTVAHGPLLMQGAVFGRVAQESRQAPRITVETYDDLALRQLPPDAPRPKPGCEPLGLGLAGNACRTVTLAEKTPTMAPAAAPAWTVMPQRLRNGTSPATHFTLVASDAPHSREAFTRVAQLGNLLIDPAHDCSAAAAARRASSASQAITSSPLRMRADMVARFYRAPAPFQRICVTHLLPRFVVVNETPWPLALVQEGMGMTPEAACVVPPTPRDAVPPPDENTACPSIVGGMPFYWPCHQSPQRIQILPLAPPPSPKAVLRATRPAVVGAAPMGTPVPNAAPAIESVTDAGAFRYGCMAEASEEAMASAAWTATSFFTLSETGIISVLSSAKAAPDGGPGTQSVALTMQVSVHNNGGQFVVTITPELSGPQSASRVRRKQEKLLAARAQQAAIEASSPSAVAAASNGALSLNTSAPALPTVSSSLVATVPAAGTVGVAPLYSVANKSSFPISICQAQAILPGGDVRRNAELACLPPMLHTQPYRATPFAWQDPNATSEFPSPQVLAAAPARAVALKFALLYIYPAPGAAPHLLQVQIEIPGWSKIAMVVRQEITAPGAPPTCTVHPLLVRVDCLADGSRVLNIVPCPFPRRSLPSEWSRVFRSARAVRFLTTAAAAGAAVAGSTAAAASKSAGGLRTGGAGSAVQIVGDGALELLKLKQLVMSVDKQGKVIAHGGQAGADEEEKKQETETGISEFVFKAPLVSVAVVDDLPSAEQASASASGASLGAKLDDGGDAGCHVLSAHLCNIGLLLTSTATSQRQEVSLGALQIDKGTGVGKSSKKMPLHTPERMPSPPVPSYMPVLAWSTLWPVMVKQPDGAAPTPLVSFTSKRAYVRSGRYLVAGSYEYWDLSFQKQPVCFNIDDEIISALITVMDGFEANGTRSKSAKQRRQNTITAAIMASRGAASGNTQTASVVLATQRALAATLASAAQSSRTESAVRIYFEQFLISPVHLRVTTRLTGDVLERLLRAVDLGGGLRTVLSALGSMLQVEQMPIDMPMLVQQQETYSSAELVSAVGGFYQQQSSKYVTNALLSSSLLGNPRGFVRGIGRGASGLTHQERQLDSRRHNLSAAEGVAMTTGRLVGNTVGGVFCIASNVTGSIASGVSHLVLDDEHRAERDQRQKEKPKNALSGVKQGAMSIGTGLFSAITGLVAQPIKGAQKDGAAGAAKGFMSAIINIPTKVVSGTLDGVTNVVEGVGNTLADNETKAPPFVPVGRPLKLQVQLLGLDNATQEQLQQGHGHGKQGPSQSQSGGPRAPQQVVRR